MLEITIRYLHFIGILGIGSTLVAEYLLLKPALTVPEVRRLAFIDALYGLSAISVLAAGLTLWFWVGKPAGFYTANPVFHIKLVAFVLLGLLSVYPTVFFIRSRKTQAALVEVPGRVVRLIRIELAVLAVIPLLAVLMARGYGAV